MLNIVEEYSRECLKIDLDRKVTAAVVIYELSGLFVERGTTDFSRSENNSELSAESTCQWLRRIGDKRLFIAPGGPWEIGCIGSANGKVRRDELQNGGNLGHDLGCKSHHGTMGENTHLDKAAQLFRITSTSNRAKVSSQLLNGSTK